MELIVLLLIALVPLGIFISMAEFHDDEDIEREDEEK